MEIYKDQAEKSVTFESPVTPIPGSLFAYAFNAAGAQIHEFNQVTAVTGGFKVILPFHLVDNYSEFKVMVRYEYLESGSVYVFERTVPLQVINPILSLAEVRAIIGVGKSEQECRDAEKHIRYIISAHTGQEFNNSIKTYKIRGTDSTGIKLPERLIRLHKFNALDYLPGAYYLDPSGYYILGGMVHAPNVKADYYEYHEIGGVIYNPNGINPSYFKKTQMYEITGMFGWEEVPHAVKEAAKILLEEYFCDDSVYRDRYIDSVSAVDWRIQFNAQAFAQTGNVRADQLLSEFVLRRGWGVI